MVLDPPVVGGQFAIEADARATIDPARIYSTPFLDRLMPRSRDLTGDGQVGGADLAKLLEKWGEERGAADLNADGVVDGSDLAELLGRWTGG